MIANIGVTGGIIRIILGLALLSLLVVLHGGARWLGLIGAVPLLTAYLSHCPLSPLHRLPGRNACTPPRHR